MPGTAYSALRVTSPVSPLSVKVYSLYIASSGVEILVVILGAPGYSATPPTIVTTCLYSTYWHELAFKLSSLVVGRGFNFVKTNPTGRCAQPTRFQ